MGAIHVSAMVKALSPPNGTYQAQFRVDTGATDCLIAGSELKKIGIQPVGQTIYELADGRLQEYHFGLAQIEFMGQVTAGRVIFGPEGVEPLLGVTALESVGVTIDPVSQTLKRLPTIPLKQLR